jgi:processing peptidase subunit beta
MVVAGAGAVDHNQLVELTQNLFGSIPTKPAKKVSLAPAHFIGSDIRVRDDSEENAHIALGFEVAGWNDADNFPLMLLQTMIGAWDKGSSGGAHSSSPLVAKLAASKTVQSIMPFNTQYSDTGLFGIHVVAEPEGLTEMMKTILNELVGFAYFVDEARLEEAKNQLKMNVLAQLDGSTVICEEIGRHMLTYGRRMHPLEVMERIEAVDAAAVRRAANRFIYDRDFALAAIGPLYELPDYNWIRSRTFFRKL